MKFIKSLSFALKGISFGFKSEQNMKFHFLAIIIAVSMALVFKINNIEWLMILLSITLVIAAELFNTAIERIIDGITKSNPQLYEEMGAPKDLSAGAVLVTAIFSIIVGLIVFLPHIILIYF